MKKCPYCAEEIQDEAVKCRFCNEYLEKKQQAKWYFKTSALLILFLCVGPFALPLVWFNPHYNSKKKILVSIIIIVLSFLMGALLVNAFKTISSYYQQMFQGY